MIVGSSRLDLSTRYFWRAIGRPVDVVGDDGWLDAPRNARGGVGDAWLALLAAEGRVRPAQPGDGLVESMADLDGPDFAAAGLDHRVRHFYEHTAAWQMQVWAQWNPLFAPGGELISRVWGRRVRQLALPVQPLAVSRGMSSTVRVVENGGRRAGAAWLRTLRSDGLPVYSGYYRIGRVPDSNQPHVHVSFPLEDGSVQVFLTPRNGADGSLWLESRSRSFGGDGAYVVVRVGDRWHAARAPLRETFHVFVDDDGALRTDHWLRLFRWQALQLHYRLDREHGSGSSAGIDG